MPRARFLIPVATHSLLACLTIALLLGCSKVDEIRRYSVPKEHLVQEIGDGKLKTKDRMLAAMFRHGSKAWFFKVSGPNQQVGRRVEEFREFLDSVRFPDDAVDPQWKLPESWKQQPGNSIRFATIEIPADDNENKGAAKPAPLELTVIPLGVTDEEDYVLDNVNRWRDQMSLPPIESQRLSDEVEQFDVAGKDVVLVNLIGGAATGRRPPFAGPHAGLARHGAAEAVVADRDTSLVECQPAEGWLPARLGPIDKALYLVRDGDKKIEISIRVVGGDLLSNVNRWREQVQLPELAADQLSESATEVQVDGRRGDFVELIGPAESILGAVVPAGGQSWFFKLKGDKQLAAREKENFLAFVESTKIPKGS